jgi:hypothetical protein
LEKLYVFGSMIILKYISTKLCQDVD